METKENSAPSLEKSSETKIVTLVLRPDGSAQVKTFKRADALPPDFNLNGAVMASNKDFASLPKRLAFFFEKGFSGVE